ncbi:MAG: DsrE family protein [Nitrososphaerota archaeon]|nr:DsrE family protein [Nitrososphaerota archaeon]
MAPADTPRLETMLGYATAAAAMEYETLIFFALDSALVAKKQIFEKMDQKVKDRIRESVSLGIKLDVCSASANTFGIKSEDLIEGVQISGIASFYSYAQDADIVLSWS